MEPSQVDIVAEYADILQIGTRNMQNYSLLREMGRVARPVMLKRGYGATVEEWLMAAEYIVSSGNPNVILCERGIRTFETYTRNTMDLAAVPLLHHLTHLPVIVDPSHATGKRWLVKPLALGGVAVGADGVMVEVHPDARPGAVRRRAAAHPGPVPRPDGRPRADPCPGARPARRPVEAGAAAAVGAGEGLAPAMIRTDVATVRPAARLRGELRLPGDKSISHRALLFATLAAGESRIVGAGDGADVRSTAGIMRALGARVEPDGVGEGAAERGGAPGRGRNVDYRVVSPGRGRPRAARRHAGLRQLRHESATHRRDARRPAPDLRPGRGRFIAPPTGRSYHRATAPDGRGAPRSKRRFPPSPHRGRAYPAPGGGRHDTRCRPRR